MSTARRQANTRTLKARKRRRPWRYAILGLGFGERIAHLSRLTQLLVFLIVTCRRRCSVPGVIPLGEAGLAEVVRWPLDDVRTGVTEAEAAGIIQRDESPLLFLRLALDEDPPANVHVLGAWHRELDNLPKSELVSVVRAAIGTLLDGEMLAEWQSLNAGSRRDDGGANGLANGSRNGVPDGGGNGVPFPTSGTYHPIPTTPDARADAREAAPSANEEADGSTRRDEPIGCEHEPRCRTEWYHARRLSDEQRQGDDADAFAQQQIREADDRRKRLLQ